MKCSLFFLFLFLLTKEIIAMILPPQTDCYNKGFICYDEDRFYQCVDIGNKTVTMGKPQFCPKGLKCNDNVELECEEPLPLEKFTNISTKLANSTTPMNIQTDVLEESSNIVAISTNDNAHGIIENNNRISTEISNSAIQLIVTTEAPIGIQNSTDEFLVISNQYTTSDSIQTETISENGTEKFESEFNQLTRTTESITKVFLQNFVDVQITTFPSTENTDESLIQWKEPIWESQVDTELEKITEVENVVSTIITDAPEDDDYEYIYDIWKDGYAQTNSSTVYDTITANEKNEYLSTESISTEKILSKVTLQNFDFAEEQEVLSAITEKTAVTVLETQNKTATSTDDEQSTKTQNADTFHEILKLQPETSKSMNVDDNLILFSANFQDSTISVYYTDSSLFTENNKLFDGAKEDTILTEGVSTESSISENFFTQSEEHVISGSTKATQRITTSSSIPTIQLINHTTSNVEEGKLRKDEGKDQEFTMTDIEHPKISEKSIILTTSSTQSISFIQSNNVLITTVIDNLEEVQIMNKSNVPEKKFYNLNVNSISTAEGQSTVGIDGLMTSDNNQSTIDTEITLNIHGTTQAVGTTAFNKLSTIEEDKNFVDEKSTAQVLPSPTADIVGQQELEISDKSIYEISTAMDSIGVNTPSVDKETTTTQTTSLEENLHSLLTSIAENTTHSIRIKLDVDENVITQQNLVDIHASTISETEFYDSTTKSSHVHTNLGEITGTGNFNIVSNTVEQVKENSTYSLPLSSTVSVAGSAKSTTDNEEIVDVEMNSFTVKDIFSETELKNTSTFSEITELVSTLSNREISNASKSEATESTYNKYSLQSTLIPIIQPQGTVQPKTSEITEKEVQDNKGSNSFHYDNETSIVKFSSNYTEFVNGEGESNSFELESAEVLQTSSVVSVFSATEVPSNISITYEPVNKSSDLEPSLNKSFSTVTPISPFLCSSVGKFADPKSCSKFYLCINAFIKYIAVSIDCPKDTLFDSTLQECTRRPVQCPGDIPLTCTTSGVYPHPTDCSRYYKCLWRSLNKNFILRQFRCPRETRYDPENRRCERTTAAECDYSFVSETTDLSFICVEVGRFAVQSSCKDYYECKEKNGIMIKYRKACPESKLFDVEWGRCRKLHLVVCPFSDYDTRENSDIEDRSVECG